MPEPFAVCERAAVEREHNDLSTFIVDKQQTNSGRSLEYSCRPLIRYHSCNTYLLAKPEVKVHVAC